MTRDEAYIWILQHGLQCMRDCSALGLVDYCAIESEHLHNIPSLLGEINESRHEYYLQQERARYLAHVDLNIEGLRFTLDRYTESWTVLEASLPKAK